MSTDLQMSLGKFWTAKLRPSNHFQVVFWLPLNNFFHQYNQFRRQNSRLIFQINKLHLKINALNKPLNHKSQNHLPLKIKQRLTLCLPLWPKESKKDQRRQLPKLRKTRLLWWREMGADTNNYRTIKKSRYKKLQNTLKTLQTLTQIKNQSGVKSDRSRHKIR